MRPRTISDIPPSMVMQQETLRRCSAIPSPKSWPSGHALGLPADLVDKTPSDGLCGMSDEDRFGFSYAVLDLFIRTGRCDDDNVKRKIIQMHNANLHKLRPVPACPWLNAA